MIKKLLREVSKEVWASNPKNNTLFKYAQLRDSPQWKVHQMFLTLIANKLVEYMLSEEFSELSAPDMKANQRAMLMTKEIIDFLFDPLKGIKNTLRIEAHNRTEATKHRKRPQGG